MTRPISWDDLDFASGDQVFHPSPNEIEKDGDRIIWTQEPGLPPDQIELVFSTAPNITWWKEIQVISPQGRRIASLAAQDDDHGPKSTVLRVAEVRGAKLTFHKAKIFGIHTGMYELPPDLDSKAGHRLTFTWLTDGS